MRMRVNRGHKPTEIHSKSKFGPGNMPVITAGSVQVKSTRNAVEEDIDIRIGKKVVDKLCLKKITLK